MNQVTSKKFKHFIGIDVSKNELDYAVMHGENFLFHEEGKNEPTDILRVIQRLKSLQGFVFTRTVFVMEHTGIYCNHLLRTLKTLKANVVVENPTKIRNSFGIIRGKQDKIDAIRIAQYAYLFRHRLTLKTNPRPEIVQLTNLFAIRNRIQGLFLALKKPLNEQKEFVAKGLHKESVKLCKQSLVALKGDLIEVERAIAKRIEEDERLKRLVEIITSVPNVGRVTAVQIILSTNEFIDISDPKKFACYAGVAPFHCESGLFKGRSKVSSIANKQVKAILHTCAITAIRTNSPFKEYFDRKCAEGKHKMSVINAVRYKIILRIFACVNQDRLFDINYTRPV